MAKLDLAAVEVGSKIRLQDETVAEVTVNPKDGMWVFGRFLSAPEDPSRVGNEDMICLYDILEVIQD